MVLSSGQELTGGVLAGKNAQEIKNVYIINANDGYTVSEGDAGAAAVGDVIYYKPVDHTAANTDAKSQTIEVLYIIKEGGVISSDNTPTWTSGTNTVSAAIAANTNPTWGTPLAVAVDTGAKTITVSGAATGGALAASDYVTFTISIPEGATLAAHTDNTSGLTVTPATKTLKLDATGAAAWTTGQKITITAADGTAVHYTIVSTVTSVS